MNRMGMEGVRPQICYGADISSGGGTRPMTLVKLLAPDQYLLTQTTPDGIPIFGKTIPQVRLKDLKEKGVGILKKQNHRFIPLEPDQELFGGRSDFSYTVKSTSTEGVTLGGKPAITWTLSTERVLFDKI